MCSSRPRIITHKETNSQPLINKSADGEERERLPAGARHNRPASIIKALNNGAERRRLRIAAAGDGQEGG